MANTEVANMTSVLEETTLDEVLSRHRRERKELQAKIQSLKKNAPKSDKKKRKEVMDEVARLEHELEHRQGMEIKAARVVEDGKKQSYEDYIPVEEVTTSQVLVNTAEENGKDEDVPQRISKAQKRRDKKSRETRQRDEGIRAAAEDAQNAPKDIEASKLSPKLKERQFVLYQIPSDGDCLYNAIRHQLIQSGLGAYSVEQLRNETANYIRANKEICICYMTNPHTGNLLNDAEFEEYCESVRSTPAWGGQIELKALSSVLKAPIEVIQAEGPPTVQGATEFAGPNLVITYHRHMYSLGEHYNSTMPQPEIPDETAEDVDTKKQN